MVSVDTLSTGTVHTTMIFHQDTAWQISQIALSRVLATTQCPVVPGFLIMSNSRYFDAFSASWCVKKYDGFYTLDLAVWLPRMTPVKFLSNDSTQQIHTHGQVSMSFCPSNILWLIRNVYDSPSFPFNSQCRRDILSLLQQPTARTTTANLETVSTRTTYPSHPMETQCPRR